MTGKDQAYIYFDFYQFKYEISFLSNSNINSGYVWQFPLTKNAVSIKVFGTL